MAFHVPSECELIVSSSSKSGAASFINADVEALLQVTVHSSVVMGRSGASSSDSFPEDPVSVQHYKHITTRMQLAL